MKRRTFIGCLLAVLAWPKGLLAKEKCQIGRGDYCVNVCGGKCCSLWNAKQERIWTCPHLKDGACSIYDEWKHKGTCGKYFPEIKNSVMSIEEGIKKKLLAPWIEDQCCYAHPELIQIGNYGRQETTT